jgi:hypothetical protein
MYVRVQFYFSHVTLWTEQLRNLSFIPEKLKIILFFTTNRPAVGPNQSSIQRLPCSLFEGTVSRL